MTSAFRPSCQYRTGCSIESCPNHPFSFLTDGCCLMCSMVGMLLAVRSCLISCFVSLVSASIDWLFRRCWRVKRPGMKFTWCRQWRAGLRTWRWWEFWRTRTDRWLGFQFARSRLPSCWWGWRLMHYQFPCPWEFCGSRLRCFPSATWVPCFAGEDCSCSFNGCSWVWSWQWRVFLLHLDQSHGYWRRIWDVWPWRYSNATLHSKNLHCWSLVMRVRWWGLWGLTLCVWIIVVFVGGWFRFWFSFL